MCVFVCVCACLRTHINCDTYHYVRDMFSSSYTNHELKFSDTTHSMQRSPLVSHVFSNQVVIFHLQVRVLKVGRPSQCPIKVFMKEMVICRKLFYIIFVSVTI
jgi:hypothetical protein